MKKFFNAVSRMFSSDPNKVQDTGYTRLQKAVVDNDLSTVVGLIKLGADINLRGNLMYPPLHLALEKDRHSIAVALIQAGRRREFAGRDRQDAAAPRRHAGAGNFRAHAC